MESTWGNRDLPVLEAIVALYERDGAADPGSLAHETGLDEREVGLALDALRYANPSFVEFMRSTAEGHVMLIGPPTSHARRAVGAWPSAEGMADRLVAAVSDAADREVDPERKGWLKRTAAYLGNAGRDVAVEIGASVISKKMGGM